MRRENSVFQALLRGVRVILRRPTPPEPRAPVDAVPTASEFMPEVLKLVTIEDYDGNDPHDRFFHSLN